MRVTAIPFQTSSNIFYFNIKHFIIYILFILLFIYYFYYFLFFKITIAFMIQY